MTMRIDAKPCGHSMQNPLHRCVEMLRTAPRWKSRSAGWSPSVKFLRWRRINDEERLESHELCSSLFSNFSLYMRSESCWSTWGKIKPRQRFGVGFVRGVCALFCKNAFEFVRIKLVFGMRELLLNWGKERPTFDDEDKAHSTT
ncbi:hypothetical protein Droror1_Dr00025211, partial [Drosera rotundifolia]